MKKWLGAALLVLAAAAQAGEVAGHYYLSGVREVGSELVLRPDGGFQWMISYGAVDRFAQGRWQRQGDKVQLRTSQPEAEPAYRLFREDELNIRKPPAAGRWVAIVGMPNVGPMSGVDVHFVGQSGQTLQAVTDRNGDAQVAAPAGDSWVRVGLRRAGSQAALQWLALPPERSSARIAAFAVDDTAYVLPQAFRQANLRVEGETLIMELEGQVLRYQR